MICVRIFPLGSDSLQITLLIEEPSFRLTLTEAVKFITAPVEVVNTVSLD
ncbi:MAG: hypothetical protein M3P82_02810 [Bacteroidota bacterium]|nr:hypothetical protein [Bacteroidota bacterium]